MWVSRKKWIALEKRVDALEKERTSTTLENIKAAMRQVIAEVKPSPKIFDD